jgi:hypothetical protein
MTAIAEHVARDRALRQMKAVLQLFVSRQLLEQYLYDGLIPGYGFAECKIAHSGQTIGLKLEKGNFTPFALLTVEGQ